MVERKCERVPEEGLQLLRVTRPNQKLLGFYLEFIAPILPSGSELISVLQMRKLSSQREMPCHGHAASQWPQDSEPSSQCGCCRMEVRMGGGAGTGAALPACWGKKG
jgi:hypothetical protein